MSLLTSCTLVQVRRTRKVISLVDAVICCMIYYVNKL